MSRCSEIAKELDCGNTHGKWIFDLVVFFFLQKKYTLVYYLRNVHRENRRRHSPSLKVMHGSVQPAQGGSFVLQERYVDIWILVVGLTVWQVWVSRCKETFTGKRTPPAENLMMIWFNLISTLRGQFESLQGSADTSEEARAHFLLKWSGSSMLQMVDGEAKWNYQPPR